MASKYCVLLLATASFTLVSGSCEEGVVSSIKQLRKGRDDSSVLNIVGDWGIVYVSGTSSAPGGFSNSTCQVSTFYKDKDGKHRASHNGLLAGGYILDFKGGAELVIDPDTGAVLRDTYVVYASPDYEVVAFYSCSVSGPDISVGSVAVSTKVLDSASTAKLVAKAEKALATVGLSYGTPLTACYKICLH